MKFTLLLIKAYYDKNYISFMDLYSKAPEFSLYCYDYYSNRWFVDLLLPSYRDDVWNILFQSFLSLPLEYCKVYISIKFYL